MSSGPPGGPYPRDDGYRHAGAAALTGGYHLAFLVGAIFAAAGAVIGGTLLRQAPLQAGEHAGHAAAPAAEASS